MHCGLRCSGMRRFEHARNDRWRLAGRSAHSNSDAERNEHNNRADDDGGRERHGNCRIIPSRDGSGVERKLCVDAGNPQRRQCNSNSPRGIAGGIALACARSAKTLPAVLSLLAAFRWTKSTHRPYARMHLVPARHLSLCSLHLSLQDHSVNCSN